MTAVAIDSVDFVGDRRMVGLLALLVSTVVLAQTAAQSDLDLTIDELQKQEIYATSGDWRKPETDVPEEAWRRPKPQVAQKSRIDIGYDSIYDDARIQREETRTTLDLEIERYKPSSAFKVKF